jgi:branched-subunit amino acid aminotransferase/4-amino-4-deoxychorismate lyase
MGIWLQQKVKAAGADDVLYHYQNIVSELPRANVFFIDRDGALITNEINILHGITRKYILQLAAKNYPVQVRDFTRSEIFNASEVFLCSTTKRILPIVKIDDHIIGNGKPGKVTSELQQDFLRLEKEAVQQMLSIQ